MKPWMITIQIKVQRTPYHDLTSTLEDDADIGLNTQLSGYFQKIDWSIVDQGDYPERFGRIYSWAGKKSQQGWDQGSLSWFPSERWVPANLIDNYEKFIKDCDFQWDPIYWHCIMITTTIPLLFANMHILIFLTIKCWPVVLEFKKVSGLVSWLRKE